MIPTVLERITARGYPLCFPFRILNATTVTGRKPYTVRNILSLQLRARSNDELSGFYLPQLITHERHSLSNLLHQSVSMYVLSLFDHLIGFQSVHSQPSFTSCYFCCVLPASCEARRLRVAGSAATHSGNLKYRKNSLLSLLRHKLHSIFMPPNTLFSKTNLIVFSPRVFRHELHLPISY